jgi:hypothetical protein
MGKLLRHRQTKGPVSARLYLNCRATPRLHLTTPESLATGRLVAKQEVLWIFR